MATILVADDEAKMRKILSLTLSEDDHEVLQAKDAEEAISFLNRITPNLIISDLRMPGGGGLAVLDAVRERRLSVPVVILTAYGTIENAVEAMHHGAYDYLLKPCDLDELKIKVNKSLKAQHLQQENVYLRQELNERVGKGTITARSESMKAIVEMLPRIAASQHPVLIQGESGTGKELIARTIHSSRYQNDAPFVVVKCVGVPADLLDLELFGQVRGPGTGSASPKSGKVELANGGTLFIDEVADLPLRLQGKLLKLIDEKIIEPVGAAQPKRVNVSLICSTNYDLEELNKGNRFRQDLFYRLNISSVLVPPLRERLDDIEALVNEYLKTKSKPGNTNLTFTAEQIEELKQYPWPGNVRELIQMLERAMVLETTELKKLLPHPPKADAASMLFNENHKELLRQPYKDAKKTVLDQFEYIYFTHLLQKTQGNVSRASELAGVHRKNFHVKLGELDIDPRQFQKDD